MKKHNHWMIVYDIRDRRRLAQVHEFVSAYGWRLQKSVYESVADETSIRHLKSMLERIVAPEDFVLIFSVCERDWQKRELYGQSADVPEALRADYLIL